MNKKHGAWSKMKDIFWPAGTDSGLFFCFNTLPLIKGFYYGLTNFRGYGSYDFVGLRNFAEIFQDSRVGHSYLFTFKYALVMTIVVNLLSLILALGLNSKIRGKNALRGIYFCTKYSGRSGCRLYLQFHFYIYSADDRRSNRN